MPSTIQKRDGRVVPFERKNIVRAIEKCYAACTETDLDSSVTMTPEAVADRVIEIMDRTVGQDGYTVERVQDTVERVLMSFTLWEPARRFIIYREEHARQRDERPIPDDVRAAYEADDAYFPTPLQRFQFLDKYSRWNADLERRETWLETVDRGVDFLSELSLGRLKTEHQDAIRDGIRNMHAMPSMRLLAMAGPAARRDNTTIFNCSAQGADSIEAFPEVLLISMAGCGAGFSVERRYVHKLPMVQRQKATRPDLFIVDDTAEGWAKALQTGLEHWFYGEDIVFNYDLIRLPGTPLKTKGGRASGPEPLKKLLDFTRTKILSRQGASLNPIDAHDIMCMVGQTVVSGGVRRTAMISLFDLDDADMLRAKEPGFDVHNDQRWNANNSAVWTGNDSLSMLTFMDRFMTMLRSNNGEPGIFNHDAVIKMMPTRRDGNRTFLTNPCGEIQLRNREFCNLSAAVARSDDTFESLAEKVRLATIIGTVQSMATYYPHLRDDWRRNGEAERLLGVDITGQVDCPMLTGRDGPEIMRRLRQVAVDTNIATAAELGINRSASVTCVKPSGNTSQLVNCSSGLHARWAPYYIRNVRVSATSPLARVLLDAGVPMHAENNQDPENPQTWVVSFPVKSPDGAITRNDRSAVEQCEYWLRNKLYWTEHNPSVTITYRPGEEIDLMQWVWDHFDKIGGMAFLPADDSSYAQLPYIEISQEEYERRMAEFPDIDFPKIFRYEQTDRTTASQEQACLSGVCEVDGVAGI
jgi:ribonucleoside-triphosphate reductase